MKQCVFKGLYGAFCAVLLIAKVSAADFSAGFAINAHTNHNDNIRLTQNDQKASTEYQLSPKIDLGVNTETSQLLLTSTLNFNRYSLSEYNSDDQNIALGLSHQFENSFAGLDLNYVHNSTLTSELLTSGQIGTRADRAEKYDISPTWAYTVNERNTIQMSATYTTQNYESSSYLGYDNKSAELDWLHQLNERLKFILATSYSDYQSDDRSITVYGLLLGIFPIPVGTQSYTTRTQTKDIQLGAEYQISENSTLSGRFGRSRNDTTQPVKDPSNFCAYGDQLIGAVCSTIPHSVNFGTTANLSWTWNNEQQRFKLNATKLVQPTSNGYAVDAIQIQPSWSYQLTELDSISIDASIVRNRAIDKTTNLLNTSLADRDYGSATLRYQRRLTESWLFSTSYRYSNQKYSSTDYQASAHVYSLGITYQPQRWHWSR